MVDCVHRVGKARRARRLLIVRLGADVEDMTEPGELGSDLVDAASVYRGGGDQHPGVTIEHALADGFGSERGEDGRRDAACLQGAEDGDGAFRARPGEHVHPLTLGDAERSQQGGEPIAGRGQLAERHRVAGSVGSDPTHRLDLTRWPVTMAVDCFDGHVDPMRGRGLGIGSLATGRRHARGLRAAT